MRPGKAKPCPTRLIIDRSRYIVEVDGKPLLNVTPAEFDLLAVLADAGGTVLDRKRIMLLWAKDMGARKAAGIKGSRTIDQHVARLRHKLGRDIVRTVPKRGYGLSAGVAVEQR